MIKVDDLYKNLKKNKISFFTGVPDSVLKLFLKKLESLKSNNHIAAFNEGSATAIAIGYHLSTGKIPCVYLQNSGLGNAINPLVSIAHQKIYSIPMLLLIGWRGSPRAEVDEPQHNVKGKITRKLLKILDIKSIIIKSNKDFPKVKNLIKFSKKKNKPVAVLIENKTIFNLSFKRKKKSDFKNGIYRNELIKILLKYIKKGTKIISTTGFTSRELHQIRREKNLKTGSDFYMIGGMGHSLMVSLGCALVNKNNVICLDGDGSTLMHLGSLRTAGIFKKRNLKHIIFNNHCHESVGGQTTFSENLSFATLAKNLGYETVMKIVNKKNLENQIKKFLKSNGPSLLEVTTKVGTLENLKRPSNFIEIKKKFMR